MRPAAALLVAFCLLLESATPLATVGALRASVTLSRTVPLHLQRTLVVSSARADKSVEAEDLNIEMTADVPPLKPAWRVSLASGVQTAGSLGSIVLLDIALRRVFTTYAIPFPSALAGMLLLFASLCGLQAFVPRVAGSIASAAAPGCTFISKWLAVL